MVVICEYVWIGGNNNLRSKTRILDIMPQSLSQVTSVKDLNSLLLPHIPNWNYDGSSTAQASGHDSEVIIKPVSIFRDPFRTAGSYLVLCETYTPKGEPLSNNHRPYATQIFDTKLENGDSEPWFGIEQEYFLMHRVRKLPLGFIDLKCPPSPQGQYYCSIGAENAFGRKIANEHMMYCLMAGIKICGINAEVAPGQWEYQIGPSIGIDSGDHLWMSRYILERVAEKHDVSVSLDPKPLEGDWNGSGCHTNYSTKYMRKGDGNGKTGLEYIHEAIAKLGSRHTEHMVVYGAGNEKRMTGEHETASFDMFSWGVANRGTSVRIGNETLQNECGYFEDRRPSSNMNPYLVTAKIYDTTTIWNGLQEPNSVNTLNEGGEYQLVNDTTQNIEKNIDLVINDTMEFVGDVCDF